MILNYKFRLYPTKEQELVLEQTLDGCRWVYIHNYFLGKNNMSSEYDMNYALTELKEQHPWLRKYYHSKMLQMVAKQVAAARKNAKRLRYRKSGDFNAFTYNQSGFEIENSSSSSNNNNNSGGSSSRLVLSKIGRIRIVLHRKPVNVKQVTICRRKKDGRWYAVVACGLLRRTFSTIIRCRKPVGIDVGITKFCHDSDDHVVENPQFLTKMLRPLRRAHRRVSRSHLQYVPMHVQSVVQYLTGTTTFLSTSSSEG